MKGNKMSIIQYFKKSVATEVNTMTYLEELSEWKKKYKTVSEEIRELKKQRKGGSVDTRSTAQWKRELKRIEARNLMEERVHLKRRAIEWVKSKDK